MVHHSKYFCGNPISEYGLKCGYVDYATFAKAFDAVLCNDIMEIGEWELLSDGVDHDRLEDLENELDCLTEDELELIVDDKEGTPEYSAIVEKIDSLLETIGEIESASEIFQYYIVSRNAVDLLQEAHEIVYYNDVLDMYVWGVTHYGTSWDMVLTDVPVDLDEK